MRNLSESFSCVFVCCVLGCMLSCSVHAMTIVEDRELYFGTFYIPERGTWAVNTIPYALRASFFQGEIARPAILSVSGGEKYDDINITIGELSLQNGSSIIDVSFPRSINNNTINFTPIADGKGTLHLDENGGGTLELHAEIAGSGGLQPGTYNGQYNIDFNF